MSVSSFSSGMHGMCSVSLWCESGLKVASSILAHDSFLVRSKDYIQYIILGEKGSALSVTLSEAELYDL